LRKIKVCLHIIDFNKRKGKIQKSKVAPGVSRHAPVATTSNSAGEGSPLLAVFARALGARHALALSRSARGS
jgi:hypothetical protein